MRLPKAPRPRWSLKTSFAAASVILLLVVALVFFWIETSIWHRLELLVGSLALFVFVFLWAVLYQGVRYDKKERFHLRWLGTERFGDLVDSVGSGMDTQGVLTAAGAEEGPVGFLLGLILDIVLSLLLVFLVAGLLWLGVNIAIASVAAVALPLFLIFSRSLRFVVARGRSCRGDLLRSMRAAGAYAAMSAVWFYTVLFLARLIPALPAIVR